MNEPLVTVIIPVFNREQFIGDTIKSVLSQTHSNIEVIIIDDNSTDTTVQKIKNFEDPRIMLIQKSKNEGVSAAMNDGIKRAGGDFIMRIDSDDIIDPYKIARQLLVFELNPDIHICGSWLKYSDNHYVLKFPELPEDIKSEMILRCPISVGSSMFKKVVFENYLFDPALRYSEDYEFWSRALFKFNAYNIQEVMLWYQQHDAQLTRNYIPQQELIDLGIRLKLLKKIGYNESLYPDRMIMRFLKSLENYSLREIQTFLEWTKHLKVQNAVTKIFEPESFNKVLSKWRGRMAEQVYFRENRRLNTKLRIRLMFCFSRKENMMMLKRKYKKFLATGAWFKMIEGKSPS